MQVKPEARSPAYAPTKISDVVSRNKDTHAINRVVRLREEWDDLGELVGKRKRAQIIRELIHWYLRYPGAKQPVRPPAEDWEARHAERAAEEAEREAERQRNARP
jgi:hypothetical protein